MLACARRAVVRCRLSLGASGNLLQKTTAVPDRCRAAVPLGAQRGEGFS